MKTKQPANIPVALSAARRQSDQWRSQHRKRTRLPKELWPNCKKGTVYETAEPGGRVRAASLTARSAHPDV